MKVHRAQVFDPNCNSLGFLYDTNMRSLRKRLNDEKRIQREVVRNDGGKWDPESFTPTLEVIDVPLTKAGVLAALSRYGNHPDNG